MEHIKFIFVLVFGILSVLVFLVIRVCKCGIPGILSKTIASLFFVFTGLSASFVSSGHPGVKFVLIGLLFGMLGDIWLDLKVTYTHDGKPWLYSGFVSFMLGHLFYIIAIIRISQMNFFFVLFSLILGILLGCLVISLEKVMKLQYGPYKKVSLIYVSLLLCTSMTAFLACFQTNFKNTALLLFFLGSLFFLASDSILSATYFGTRRKEAPVWIILNHVTYYAAQYLIASSLLFL